MFQTISKNKLDSQTHPARLRAQWYVRCFSGKSGDNLSQWRAYGGGENGYAIGFFAASLKEYPLHPAVYEDQNSPLATQLCDGLCQMFSRDIRRQKPHDRMTWAQKFLSHVGERLDPLGTVIKHPAFTDEDEFRLRYAFEPERDLQNLKFRQSNSLLTRYLELEFCEFKKNSSVALPIAEIAVGPSRHQAESEESLRLLPQKHGYSDIVKTSRSRAPFQNT